MALAVKDSLEFDNADGNYPDIIHISGTVYAIAYCKRIDPRGGYLKTVSIGNDGDIGSVIDTLIFDSGGGVSPSIIHVSGNIYAIAYQGPDVHGWVATVEISTAGAITDAIVDSYEFDASQGYYPRILHISGTTYAIAYTGPGDDGWLKTLTIANDGTIAADPSLDSLEFDTGYAVTADIIHVSGDIYAISYVGYNATTKYDCRIVTVDIDSAGVIGDAIVDSLQILPPPSPPQTEVTYTSRMVHVVGDTFAVAYKSLNAALTQKLILNTFTIDSAGAIGAAIVDSLEVATAGSYIPDLCKLSDRYYAVAYSGLGTDGFLDTIIIEANGSIASAVTQSLEFDTSYCSHAPYILAITLGIVAVAYEGPDYDGWLKTLSGVSAVYPNSSMSRVGSIRHIYRPGIMQMAVTIGAVTTDVPQTSLGEVLSAIPTTPKAPTPDAGKVTIEKQQDTVAKSIDVMAKLAAVGEAAVRAGEPGALTARAIEIARTRVQEFQNIEQAQAIRAMAAGAPMPLTEYTQNIMRTHPELAKVVESKVAASTYGTGLLGTVKKGLASLFGFR